MTHDQGMPHARRTVPHHAGWKGSSVCSEPQRAYGTQTRSLDWLQQPRIYMHTNSSHCRMRLFPYEKLAPFWMQKFPFSLQTLPRGGLAALIQAPWPPERLGGYGQCHVQCPLRAVCPFPSFYSPDSPGTEDFIGKTTYGPRRPICVCPSAWNPRSSTSGHLPLEVPQGLNIHTGQLKECFNYSLSSGKTVHSVHRDPQGQHLNCD